MDRRGDGNHPCAFVVQNILYDEHSQELKCDDALICRTIASTMNINEHSHTHTLTHTSQAWRELAKPFIHANRFVIRIFTALRFQATRKRQRNLHTYSPRLNVNLSVVLQKHSLKYSVCKLLKWNQEYL